MRRATAVYRIVAAGVAIPILLFPAASPSQSHLVPPFPLKTSELELSRLAQPNQYFDKIGTRAAIMGFESGSFEMWVWPWKVLRNFELSFLLGTSTQPIRAGQIVRTISITPEATVITYTYESFTVRNIILVPRNEPGSLQLLDVHTTTPLTVVASFIPVMQPMWPAGVGGQFSYWDAGSNAYIISEGQWRGVFLCGSPTAQQMAAPPAHMFADNPLQFKIDLKPEDSGKGYIPLVIAGGHGMGADSARAVYDRLWHQAGALYLANVDYYETLRSSTLQVQTPDRNFDLAFEWGKISLDNLLIENPLLGRGMVAGYGLSGGGGRPGFAWFFGGDAFINSLAMNSYGAHRTVRDALKFTQRWQRQEEFPVRKKKPDGKNPDVGKMAHELSQSDGLCDWWNDYHYGYNHADTTPWYIVAAGEYVRSSGDIGFLKESWNSLKQAYDWCLRKDSDGDGLMDLKGAGLGALEFGKLVGIYADVYTCGVWVAAIREMIGMADLMEDPGRGRDARLLYSQAQASLERKFWMEEPGLYSYGATEQGEQVKEHTPWPGVAMMFGVVDPARARRSFLTLNGADICTDWGVRSLSHSSPLFEPSNYNYGAVWPFIGSFFNTAQYRYGYSCAASQILEANVRHAFDYGAGIVPEVFSGEVNAKLEEGYHHQGFSTTGYMLPLLRGLLGLDVNALKNTISLSPRLPAWWNRIVLRSVRVGASSYDLIIVQSDSTIGVTVESESDKPVRVLFSPEIPAGARIRGGFLGRLKVAEHPDTLNAEVRNGEYLGFLHTAAPLLGNSQKNTAPGAENTGLRIVSYANDPANPKSNLLIVEGMPGREYTLPLLRAYTVASVTGASLQDQSLLISFEPSASPGFMRKVITLTLQ